MVNEEKIKCRIIVQHVCDECGSKFIPKRYWQRFCNDKRSKCRAQNQVNEQREARKLLKKKKNDVRD